MIQLKSVSKVYRVGPVKVTALDGVSLEIEKGEFTVLAGPSGSGKTTLLRPPHLRRAVGVVFQDAKLLPARNVYDNVAFVLRVLGTPRREITPRVMQTLKAVGISARAQALPAQLSQGEQQRAALARALIKEPALLLADEPTGNLDEAMADEILYLLNDIWNRGTTILLATHRATLADQLKRRTLVLDGGRLLKDEA